MKDFLLELVHKSIETFVVVVTTASTKWIIVKCIDKNTKKATPTPRKRKKGGSS